MTSEIDYPRLPLAGVISTSEEAGDYARECPHLCWQPRLGGWLAEHEGEIRQLIGGITASSEYLTDRYRHGRGRVVAAWFTCVEGSSK